MPTPTATQRRSARASAPPAGGLEIKVRAFELKTLGADEPGSPASFSGHGAAFHNVDSAGDIIAPGAFAEDLADFLAEGHIGGLNHNWDDPIARPVVAFEDSKGLYLETGEIVDTAHGIDVAKLLRKGIIRKLSIGFRVLREQRIASMEALDAYWKSHQYTPSDEDIARATQAVKVGHVEYDEDGDRVSVKGVRMLRRIKLYEVSPVTVPANMLADVTAVKSRNKSTKSVQPSLESTLESRADFGSYAREVATASGALVERVKRRASIREKAGRVLNQANVDLISSVADALESNVGQLRDILARAQPKRIDEPATDAAKSDARPDGADRAADVAAEPATPAVPIPATVDPAISPVPPAPGPDDADILAQYIATRRAATLALAGSLLPCPAPTH